MIPTSNMELSRSAPPRPTAPPPNRRRQTAAAATAAAPFPLQRFLCVCRGIRQERHPVSLYRDTTHTPLPSANNHANNHLDIFHVPCSDHLTIYHFSFVVVVVVGI